MLGKIVVALTGLLAMSAPIVQGAEVSDNLVNGNVHGQGLQLEDPLDEHRPLRGLRATDRQLSTGRRWLMTYYYGSHPEVKV